MLDQSGAMTGPPEMEADQEVDLTGSVINNFERYYSLFHNQSNTADHIAELSHLRQSLVEQGRDILPLLFKHAKEDKHKLYQFLCLSEESVDFRDVFFLADMLNLPTVKDNGDGSNISHICNQIKESVYAYRAGNGNQPTEELNSLADVLIEKAGNNYANPNSLGNVYAAIAATGAEKAKEFLSSKGVDGQFGVVMALGWTPEAGEDLNTALNLYVNDDEADSSDRSTDTDNSELDLDELPEDMDSDRSETGWRVAEKLELMNPDEVSVIADNVKVIVDDIPDLEGSVRELARFHLMNYLVLNPQANDEELNLEIAKIMAISDKDKEYLGEANFLATIGLELEVPFGQNAVLSKKTLSKLGINYWPELPNLFEVTTAPSYGPWVQSRMLHEMALLGIVPLETIDTNRPENDLWNQKISRKIPLSMHINFGVPENIGYDQIEQEREVLHRINEVLTIAYASRERLLDRKTRTAIRWSKQAEKTKKSQQHEENNSSEQAPLRIEMRANEFQDVSTYRLLTESQRLISMFITALNHDPDNTARQDMRDLSLEFSAEVDLLFDHYGYELRTIDYEWAADVIDTIDQPELRKACRGLARKYSKKVNDYLVKSSEKIAA